MMLFDRLRNEHSKLKKQFYDFLNFVILLLNSVNRSTKRIPLPRNNKRQPIQYRVSRERLTSCKVYKVHASFNCIHSGK